MDREIKLNEVFNHRINSKNLSAAITAQTNSAGEPEQVTFTAPFINRVLREERCDFNFHLHTASSVNDYFATPQRMSSDEQRTAALEYDRRRDISVLILSAAQHNPDSEFHFISAGVPIILLKESMTMLRERFLAFNGKTQSGLLILLTCDLEGYAYRLEAHLLELAHLNNVEPGFLDWIEDANFFCNTFTGHFFRLRSTTKPELSLLFPGKC